MSSQASCEPLLIQTSALQAPGYLEFLFWQLKHPGSSVVVPLVFLNSLREQRPEDGEFEGSLDYVGHIPRSLLPSLTSGHLQLCFPLSTSMHFQKLAFEDRVGYFLSLPNVWNKCFRPAHIYVALGLAGSLFMLSSCQKQS